MSISDTQKLDLIWKKLIFNVSDSQVNVKQATEEIIPSLLPLYGNNVWSDSKYIPIPASINSVVSLHSIQCVSDPTVPNNRTWIPVIDLNNSPLDKSNRIQNWIPPTFDSSYLIKVYAGNPANNLLLNSIDNGNEWIFDYTAGVLTFINNIPESVNDYGIWIVGFQYVGEFGVVKPSDISGFIKHISDDISPKLGGDLDINGFNITGTSIKLISDNIKFGNNVWPSIDGKQNQVLSTDGNGVLIWKDLLTHVSDDTSPKLGGNLDVTGFNIFSDSDIVFIPKGNIQLGVNVWPSVDGTYKQVLMTNGSGYLEWGNVINDQLETPITGSYNQPINGVNPAINSWVINQTKYSDALDDLNRLLGKLIPLPPPPLSSKNLNINGNTNYKISNNLPLNNLILLSQNILRVISSNISTDIVTTFGNGESGILSVFVNDVNAGSANLNNTDLSGVYGSLQIISDEDYPISQPGFHRALSAKIVSDVLPGLNSFKLLHSETGYIERQFIYDNINIVPLSSVPVLTENTSGTLYFSSNVPHYTSDAIINVSSIISNLSTMMFVSNNIVQIISDTNDIVNLNPGDNNIPANLDNPQPPINLENVQYKFNNNSCVQTKIGIRGINPSNVGQYIYSDTLVNVMSGNVNSILEMNIPVINVGAIPDNTFNYAGRIIMSDGDTPLDDISLLYPNWNSISMLNDYDATVVCGSINYDVTNYSVGYLPVGPDLSTRVNSNQYITFMFRRSATSQFKIKIKGNYSGCWVKLPGITNIPNSLNGWWDMFSTYNNAGTPGRDTNGPGCAFSSPMTGTDIDAICTFGTETSSNSVNNIILVRFKLISGQKITGLSFEGVV